jgi:hypothetical protein
MFNNFVILAGMVSRVLSKIVAICRCLCIFVEELFQFQSRYNRTILNLFKLCFSGISWKPVIAVVLIDVIVVVPCALAKKSSFGPEDVISTIRRRSFEISRGKVATSSLHASVEILH